MSTTVAARPNTALDLHGSRWTWGRDLALLGFFTPMAAASLWAPWAALHPYVLIFSTMAAATGFPLGMLGAEAMERMRGHVPIPLLAALALTASGAWGMSLGVLATWMGAHQSVVVFGLFVPGLLSGLAWLPYTVLRVTGRPTWPVLLLTALSAVSWYVIGPALSLLL